MRRKYGVARCDTHASLDEVGARDGCGHVDKADSRNVDTSNGIRRVQWLGVQPTSGMWYNHTVTARDVCRETGRP
jgi:glycine/serine hydroxymethyltransferase